MSKDMMWECERETVFVNRTDPANASRRTQGWVVSKVSEISEALKNTRIRCMYCHGPVRIHRQKQTHGTRDHVEHRVHEDSENCKGGFFFKGTHRMSMNPIA